RYRRGPLSLGGWRPDRECSVALTLSRLPHVDDDECCHVNHQTSGLYSALRTGAQRLRRARAGFFPEDAGFFLEGAEFFAGRGPFPVGCGFRCSGSVRFPAGDRELCSERPRTTPTNSSTASVVRSASQARAI